MSSNDRCLRLYEALLAAWCLGTGVLAAEVLQVSSVRLLHLSGLTFDLALARIWALYAAAFTAVGLLAWLLTLPFRWLPAGRLAALLFLTVACAAPSVVYPFLIATGGRRPGSFFGVSQTMCLLAGLSCWLLAGWIGRSQPARRDLQRTGWLALVFAVVPFAASAVVLAAAFALDNAEGVPLRQDSAAFRALQVLVVLLAGWLFSRHLRGPARGPSRWLRAQVLLSVALVALALVGRFGLATAGRAHAAPGALVLVVDTLRADALSPYGGPTEDTPHLARLREDCVLFERCVAPSPWTLPSFASLFTSTYPSEHLAGARFSSEERGVGPISPETVTLAETLGAADFRTVASLTNSNLERIPNIDRGFERFSNGHSLPSYHPTSAWIVLRLLASQAWYPVAELQTRWILDELALASRDRRPFLVLGHYTDPHIPYCAPRRFQPQADGQVTLRERYRGEVRYVDAGIGALLDELRERGLYDDLLIVFTADHGEELDELRRGRKKLPSTGIHGHTLFEEQLHVPLLIKLPGQRLAGSTRPERVSLLDLAPTVLAALGVERPPAFRGWDLFDPANEPRYAGRVVLAEAVMRREEQRAGYRGDLKVVLPDLPPADCEPQQFQLGVDPRELAPGALEEGVATEIYETIVAHLRFWSARAPGGGAAGTSAAEGGAPAELDPALLEHMKGLGYTE